MLKGYEILKTIPAYDFSDAMEFGKFTTKEEQNKYKEESSKNDCKEVRKTIKHILHKYDNDKETIFVLNTILNNLHLLRKTKLAYDGSFRNIRVCAFDYKDEDGFPMYDFDEDIKYTSFNIDWNNAVNKNICWNDWSDFDKALTREDIIKVLNNIEEIFIQA